MEKGYNRWPPWHAVLGSCRGRLRHRPVAQGRRVGDLGSCLTVREGRPGGTKANPHRQGRPLSASLDRFFRPQAPAPIYLLGTLWLFGPFKGIMADLRQGDIPGVQNNYRACKASYRKVVGVVPDWTDRFLM